MIKLILCSLLLIQASQGQSDSPLTDTPLKQYLEEQIQEIFAELIEPLNAELSNLNTTIIQIKQHIAFKKLINDGQALILANSDKKSSTPSVIKEVEDQCRNLTDYLPQVEEAVEKAFYMSADLTGALAGFFVDGMDCFSINPFKAASCFFTHFQELRDIYQKYKPEINPMIEEMKVVFTKLMDLFEECLHSL